MKDAFEFRDENDVTAPTLGNNRGILLLIAGIVLLILMVA